MDTETLVKRLEDTLTAMKLVLPYLDRDGDGASDYCVDGAAGGYRKWRDFKLDIADMEKTISSIQKDAGLASGKARRKASDSRR